MMKKAVSKIPGVRSELQVILPRKGVVELQRLLQDPDAEVKLVLGNSLFRASTSDFTFTSKLVDGKFPDYECCRAVPPKPCWARATIFALR